ncbi:MAG TPA: chemotaxis protein [Spirochaetia bacterium]|nr:chemotaxis protein [Spirochaetia bacterium]
MGLVSVISVEKDNCVNCHKCIRVCPVKFCNDGSQDHVEINPDLCIGCGECLKACDHEARIIKDDFDLFLNSAEKKEKMIAVSAPAAASNFPDQYLRLNGWLKSLGVEAFFDVSFGAELTVKSYLEHLSKNNPKMIIAQPCPALVTYIQIYQPELIPHLAPADSPMMHTIKMIKEFYPQYRYHKVMIISPCVAKKREFTEVGMGDFNVTMIKIKEYLKKKTISLASFPEVDFHNDPAERAVLFSTPGGLLETAERDLPRVGSVARKIEGPELIYKYFKHLPKDLAQKRAPKLLDCLNCEMGCNGGTGTDNREKSLEEVEKLVSNRDKKARKKYQDKIPDEKNSVSLIHEAIKKYWKPGLYQRKYKDLSSLNTVKIPSQEKVDEIYLSMEKKDKKDILNCGSCGYENCENMAVAVYNGLNRVENCHYFLQKRLQRDKKTLEKGLSVINEKVEKISASSAMEASETVQKMVLSMNHIVDKVAESSQMLKQLSDNNKKISSFIEGIGKISKQTHLLSINAGIESSKFGTQGRGFNVVAQEIKKLSFNTANFIREIEILIKEIRLHTEKTVVSMEQEKEEVVKGEKITQKIAGVLNDIVDDTKGILKILGDIKEVYQKDEKEGYGKKAI